MVKIIFAPGCYGTFLSKCLYSLTNLTGQKQETEFRFDSNGSSHDFRREMKGQSYIECGHPHIISYDNQDKLVVVLPCNDHRLDYYSNQFCKQDREQIVSYLYKMFSPQEIKYKLTSYWNYRNDLSEDTPRWLLREWCSFWLEDCLSSGYNIDTYKTIPAHVYINTLDLFVDLKKTLEMISCSLGLKVVASESCIKDIQQKFIVSQKLHGIQNRCNDWVNTLLEGRNTLSPCITLFDEAWVQHLLRCRGYEIQCDGLEYLPQSSEEMLKIIYKNV
jgi:hypothetical protein